MYIYTYVIISLEYNFARKEKKKYYVNVLLKTYILFNEILNKYKFVEMLSPIFSSLRKYMNINK